MSVVVLASFTAVVREAEGAFGVFGSGIVEQQITDPDPLEDFNAAVTITATGTGTGAPSDGGGSLATAAESRIRWTGSRVKWIDADLHPSALTGAVTLEQDMTPGRQATFAFQTIGQLWAMPTPADFDDTPADPGDPAPPAPPAPPADDTSPRPWGNKPVEGFFSFGKSPRFMNEMRVFKGVSLQKSNRGDIAITGEIVCADESIRYADVPLCYELEAFAGKTRGQITRELALSVGVPSADIDVPAGHIVTKPILLSNASLIPFLAELWKGENGFPYFDENGVLRVERIEVKDTPDWTLDATTGDYDLDSFEEIPPARPPSRYYVSGAIPADASTTDGTDTTTDEETGPYNPLCVKVRPSGLASNLQASGEYTVNASDSVMVVRRTITERTTTNTRLARQIVSRFAWYNPFAYDPNFDTAPPGTSYDGAYGDQTFHRDEAESLMLVATETTEYSYDVNGTLLRQVDSVEGWYAPKRAGNYAADRVTLTNGPGAYVFPCSSTRTIPVEVYGTTKRIEKNFIFDATGTLVRISEKSYGWFAPPAACDVYKDSTTGAVLPPPSSPVQSPCPGTPGAGGGGDGPPAGPPTFQPTFIGPTAHTVGSNEFTFQWSLDGIPTGVVADINITGANIVQHGSFNFVTTAPFQGYYEFIPNGDPVEEQAFDAFVSSTATTGQWIVRVPGPQGGIRVSPYTYVVLAAQDGNGAWYYSDRIYFDSRLKSWVSTDGSTERYLLV
jgi:hypothetical protein